MKNIKVEYRQEVTINLGDFQNIKPFYSMSAEVEEGEKPSDVFRRVRGLVEKLMEEEVSQIQADRLNG